MNWFVAVASYVVIWWITIFAVLPFGSHLSEEGDMGRAAGAPANPRLKLKILVTTGIASVLWLALYWAVTKGVMNFRGTS